MSGYFCAACGVKNCIKKMGEEGEYPRSCPSTAPEMAEYRAMYDSPEDYHLARFSTLCSPDHSECRVLKTIRFAKECGFHRLGLAFCTTLREDAREVDRLLREAGFQVESLICKVGHLDRSFLDVAPSSKCMCNPIAQAEMLNRAGTELNILLGLCVGHDTLFIKHSAAPVTVLAAKDHVYNNAPMEYLRELREAREKEKEAQP